MSSSRLVACAGLSLASILAIVIARGAAGGDDPAAGVRKQCEAFVAAWNKHDAKAMAAVFDEDADAIDPMGHKATGRAEIEKAFAADQTGKGMMRDSTVTVKEEPLRFVTGDVAVTDAEVEIAGVYGPDGSKMGPLSVHVTNVWKKSGDTWWVYASRPHINMPPPPAK